MADIATLKRGFTCEFLQMLKKHLIDLSVPNLNVTDCILNNLRQVVLLSRIFGYDERRSWKKKENKRRSQGFYEEIVR